MRRVEGFELLKRSTAFQRHWWCVSNGKSLTVNVPDDCVGTVIQKLGLRKGAKNWT